MKTNIQLSYLDLYKKQLTGTDYYLVSFRPVSNKESVVSIDTKWILLAS